MNVRSLLASGAVLLVAGGVGLAFATVGSPAHARAVAIDDARLAEIRSIASEVDLASRHGATISAPVTMPPRRYFEPGDAQRRSIAYARIDDRRYRLCTTFAFASDPGERNTDDDAWRHGTGRTCYEMAVENPQPLRVITRAAPKATP